MFTSLVRTSQQWAQKTARAYRTSREGVAAIEFAFVAPIMILMYIGLAELSLLITEDRRVSHAANVAGDLTTQQANITRDDMSNIMNAAFLTLGGNENAGLKIEITSYSLDPLDSSNVITNGQATLGGPFGDVYDTSNIDSRLLNASSGVVVARVAFDYELSLINYNSDTNGTDPISRSSRTINLSDTFLLKPRTAAQVIFTADASGSTTFNCNYSGGKPSC